VNQHELVWQRRDETVFDRNVLYRMLTHDELMNKEIL
jgi:hypothetical protein